jgi:hypothetical protein
VSCLVSLHAGQRLRSDIGSFEILNCAGNDVRIIAKRAHAGVAIQAHDASDLTRGVVVINLSGRAAVADSTQSPLRVDHSLNVVCAHPIFLTQVVMPTASVEPKLRFPASSVVTWFAIGMSSVLVVSISRKLCSGLP